MFWWVFGIGRESSRFITGALVWSTSWLLSSCTSALCCWIRAFHASTEPLCSSSKTPGKQINGHTHTRSLSAAPIMKLIICHFCQRLIHTQALFSSQIHPSLGSVSSCIIDYKRKPLRSCSPSLPAQNQFSKQCNEEAILCRTISSGWGRDSTLPGWLRHIKPETRAAPYQCLPNHRASLESEADKHLPRCRDCDLVVI